MEQNPNERIEWRDLFVGLGGTGGKALKRLYDKMSPEQRNKANYIYLDTDVNACKEISSRGIKTIRISNAKQVREIARSIGENNKPEGWLPWNEDDTSFLNSNMEGGASQCRFKSRLCFARFLENPNNELYQMLEGLSVLGSQIENCKMRVIIVSSIAGGTGAGTFIQAALYIRKFFRDKHQPSVSIIGILGCPDLYTGVLNKENGKLEDQIRRMNANAYAAIRELNAMNIATSRRANDAEYGSNIDLSIDTDSEGRLFRSDRPEFQNDPTTRPFSAIYFIDKTSKSGGIMRDVDQYYMLMAETGYLRLYSPLEGEIASIESNEEEGMSLEPTAIYGSCGFARIVYPYDAIIRYLAGQKTVDDIDMTWQEIDDSWFAECESERDIAQQEGTTWREEPGKRARRYVEYITSDLDGPREESHYRFLETAIRKGKNAYRTDDYFDDILAMAKPTATDDSHGRYGIDTDTEIKAAIRSLRELAHSNPPADPTDKNLISHLQKTATDANAAYGKLASQLSSEINALARALASAILPVTESSIQKAGRDKNRINLRYGLLRFEGKDVHPLAARFLLYQFREKVRAYCGERKRREFETKLAKQARELRLAFDPDTSDTHDITVDNKIEDIRNIRGMRNRVSAASAAVALYKDAINERITQTLSMATKELVSRAFDMISGPLDELIHEYETFFGNLKQTMVGLKNNVTRDLKMHDNPHDRIIFVGANSKLKSYYYSRDGAVKAVLDQGKEECYSAYGASIYESLEKRMVSWNEWMEDNRNGRRVTDESDYEFTKPMTGMSGLFDTVVAKLSDYLQKKATTLKVNVVTALSRQICLDHGIDLTAVNTDNAARTNFNDAFKQIMDNLIAKASPMASFNEHGPENDFNSDDIDTPFDVSNKHVFLGVNRDGAAQLAELFPTVTSNEEGDVLEVFKQVVGVGKVSQHEVYKPNELFCFCAATRVQPAQITRFNERVEGAYYKDYRETMHLALSNNLLSISPHLDKHWHLKGSLPYLSRQMELDWRRSVMMAFIYCILQRRIFYRNEGVNRSILLYNYKGELKPIEYPEGEEVILRNISNVVEFLGQDELTVEYYDSELRRIINARVKQMANYAQTPRIYKGGMTTDELLKRLREDALTSKSVGKRDGGSSGDSASNMTPKKIALANKIYRMHLYNVNAMLTSDMTDEDDEPIEAEVTYDENDETEAAEKVGKLLFDYTATMGSILRIAYKMHMSEERLLKDRDNGEELIKAVLEVIDIYACGMYGPQHRTGNTVYSKKYVEIYNWGMDRFLESYVKQVMFEKALDPDTTAAIALPERDMDDLDPTTKRSVYKNIPMSIQDTDEFRWIMSLWKPKKLTDGEPNNN